MISLACALTLFSTVFFVFRHYVPMYSWIGIFLGLGSMMGFNYLVTKVISEKIKAIFETYQKYAQAGKFETAISTLETGYKYSKWQFGVKGQVKAQIGITYYLRKDFSKAMPLLKKAFAKNWVARAMLAIIHMKKNNMEEMVKVFDKAVKANPKESLLWSLYAYSLTKKGKNDAALKVLIKAHEKLPDDSKIKSNLFALKNRKKMKLKMYGAEALQFQIDRNLPSISQDPRTAMFHARRAGGSKRRR